MKTSAEYTVHFGSEPRTVRYEDRNGVLLFDFVLHRGGYGRYERWLVQLSAMHAVGNQNHANLPDNVQNHVKLTRQRVEEFLNSHGYWLLPDG